MMQTFSTSTRWIIKDHVPVPVHKFHLCPPKWRPLWVKLINRKDLPKITDHTRICSNHFVLGKPIGIQPHPSLYMRGYSDKDSQEDEASSQSPGPSEEATSQTPVSPVSGDHSYGDHHDTVPSVGFEYASQPLTSQSPYKSSPYKSSSYSTSDLREQYNYCFKPASACTCSCVCEKCQMKSKHVVQERDGILFDRDIQEELLHERDDFERMLSHEKQSFPVLYDISAIKHSDELMRLHTGIENYAIFQWMFNEVRSKLPSIHYFKGVQSQKVKRYQIVAEKKPGPQRKLSHENELLLTLMKLKLKLSLKFLAYLFKICTSVVSQIISTWLAPSLLAYTRADTPLLP
ncbi:uncharacterized protein LOC125894701 [Epinephelus fuscoguttatus]|uniref:uncharacterized protein LOC125894701 n=1 Tax=Epinephelus fuscoguttatus TaxID=293821 RepID=UPI0020CFF63D|nr:uncharacterized protein LOC125894701 [Epinephelus fuscoguttatus]